VNNSLLFGPNVVAYFKELTEASFQLKTERQRALIFSVTIFGYTARFKSDTYS
jgi:uncharacterized protein with HEPN domain